MGEHLSKSIKGDQSCLLLKSWTGRKGKRVMTEMSRDREASCAIQPSQKLSAVFWLYRIFLDGLVKRIRAPNVFRKDPACELKVEDKQDWLWEERCFFWGKIAEDKGTMNIKRSITFTAHVPPHGLYFTVSVTFAEFWDKSNNSLINKTLLTLYPPEAKRAVS